MISILMSTKNPIEKYFIECLDSIFNQTYQDFEIILVDDGSDFDIMEIIKKQNYDLEKIKIYKINNDRGLPVSLNYGLKKCKGEFIARIDDDDVMYPTRLEESLLFIKNNKLDACWTYFERIDKDGNSLGIKKIKLNSKKFLNFLLRRGNIFCHSTLFLKKSVLESVGGYDENLKFAQDNDLYIRLLDNYKFDIIRKPLLKNRINDYRNNSYRETLQFTYSLFGAVNHYTDKDKKSYKSKIILLLRILRYYIGIIKIEKRNREK